MKRNYMPASLSALVVIALAAAYLGGVLIVIRTVSDAVLVQVIIAGVGLIGIGGVAWALVSRILELKRGQEDDIGKY